MKVISTILICMVLEIMPSQRGFKYKVVTPSNDTGIVYCDTKYSVKDTIFIKE